MDPDATNVESEEPAKKPRRRWSQYSLRTLFLVTTIIAVACGWYVHHRAAVRREAIELDALQLYADCCTEVYQKVNVLKEQNARGGEAITCATAGREAWLAAADLDLARGDTPLAISDLKTALRFADEAVEDVNVNMGGEGPSDAVKLKAFAGQRDVELRLAALYPEAIDEVRNPSK